MNILSKHLEMNTITNQFYSKEVVVDCKYVLTRDVLKKMSIALHQTRN